MRLIFHRQRILKVLTAAFVLFSISNNTSNNSQTSVSVNAVTAAAAAATTTEELHDLVKYHDEKIVVGDIIDQTDLTKWKIITTDIPTTKNEIAFVKEEDVAIQMLDDDKNFNSYMKKKKKRKKFRSKYYNGNNGKYSNNSHDNELPKENSHKIQYQDHNHTQLQQQQQQQTQPIRKRNKQLSIKIAREIETVANGEADERTNTMEVEEIVDNGKLKADKHQPQQQVDKKPYYLVAARHKHSSDSPQLSGWYKLKPQQQQAQIFKASARVDNGEQKEQIYAKHHRKYYQHQRRRQYNYHQKYKILSNNNNNNNDVYYFHYNVTNKDNIKDNKRHWQMLNQYLALQRRSPVDESKTTTTTMPMMTSWSEEQLASTYQESSLIMDRELLQEPTITALIDTRIQNDMPHLSVSASNESKYNENNNNKNSIYEMDSSNDMKYCRDNVQHGECSNHFTELNAMKQHGKQSPQIIMATETNGYATIAINLTKSLPEFKQQQEKPITNIFYRLDNEKPKVAAQTLLQHVNKGLRLLRNENLEFEANSLIENFQKQQQRRSPNDVITSTINEGSAIQQQQHGYHWPIKREAVVEGELILGGLMMVHSREDTIICGPIMPQGGIQALEAMLYTIDRINESGLLPNITIGAHVLDDCDKDSYGLEMAVDFIKGHMHESLPKSNFKEKWVFELYKNYISLAFQTVVEIDRPFSSIKIKASLRTLKKEAKKLKSFS